jgi:hypothetical protein
MRLMSAMSFKQTALERAFDVARLGHCERVEDIRRQIIREGFNQSQAAGSVMGRQLLQIARQARVSGREGGSN